MKKIYLMPLAFLTSITFGQLNTDGPSIGSNNQTLQKSIYQQRDYLEGTSRPGTLLFSETFPSTTFSTGGNTGVWTRTGDGSSGGTFAANQLWLHDTDGPNGAYSDPSQGITSTTVNNGYLMMDADFFNGGGGPPTTVETFHAEVVSPIYNLTGNTDVIVSFEQAYRICCSPAMSQLWLEVSTDGFNNIHGTWDVMYADAGINEASGTRTKIINISNAITGNPATTQIRFRFGTSGSTDNASHYFWSVDDFKICEAYDFHGSLDTLAWHADINNYQYGNIPVGFQQIPGYAAANTTLTWTGYLHNMGATDWTGAMLNVDQNGSAFATSAGQSVTANSYSSEFSAGATMSSTPGTYTYTLYGTAQQAMEIADTASFDITVTDSTYSCAGSSVTDVISGTDWVWTTPPVRAGFGGEFIATSGVDEIITSIDVAFQDTSLNSFAPMSIEIYINNSTTPITEQAFQVDAMSMGAYQRINLDNEVQVTDGDTVTYYVVDNDATARFLASGSSAYHIGLILTYDGANMVLNNFLTTPAMVNVNTYRGTLDITEQNKTLGFLGQNNPNPFGNNTVINFALNTNENVQFEVRDVTGKIVKTMNLGFKGKGQHQIELNGADFNGGIYFYTLIAGDSKLTKKMVITK